MDLGGRFKKGAFWVYVQGWISAVVTFGGGIVMARLLEPEEFGLFIAVTAYTAIIGRQLQLGIPEALLRTPEEDMKAVHSGFWVMQALALICTLITAILAPWLGEVYGGHQYVWVMWAMAALFLFQPLCFSSHAVLWRRMRHDVVARITLFGNLGSTVVAISAAAGGLGVYALVLGSVVSSSIMVVLSLWFSGWRPAFSFDWKKARNLSGYGWRVHAANSFELAADRVDAMFIGKVLDLNALGIYRRADSTAKLAVTELLGRLYTLVFALFARLSTDVEGLRLAFRKLCTAVLAPVFLVLLWIWISMGDFIGFLYGDKWLPAVPYARVLVIAAMLMSLRGLLSMYLSASGHAGKQAGIGLLDLFLTTTLVGIGVQWGLEGVAWAIVGRYAILLGVSLVVIRRYSDIRMKDFASAVWPVIISTGILALLGIGITEIVDVVFTSQLYTLLANGALLVVCYLAILFLLHRIVPNNEGLEALFGLIVNIWRRFRVRLSSEISV